jgi:hypothetical protein
MGTIWSVVDEMFFLEKFVKMRTQSLLFIVACSVFLFQGVGRASPNNSLAVVIIRHGEKASNNHNLSCKGQNRALQLPAVLDKKFPNINHAFVPALGRNKFTSHARMFQTVTPFAIKKQLPINSKYAGKNYDGIAKHILSKDGTVLLVWEHSKIKNIAQGFGVKNPPEWSGKDFHSIGPSLSKTAKLH